MTATLEDTLNANLVFIGVELLNDMDAFERFRKELAPDLRLEAGLVATNDLSVAPEPSRSLILGRDRLRLTLHASRSTIAREYPDDAGLDRLAEVACRAIEPTKSEGKEPRAFGYNMEMVFNQDSGQPAIQYIGSRMFGSLLSEDPERDFVGGTGQLILENADGRWTISIEPRFSDFDTSRVFLSLNLHKQEQRFPDEAEIRTTLEKVQQEALAFMDRLEGSEASS